METKDAAKCDICRKPVVWPSHYGDWECPHCHQRYEYDEGLKITLTDAQWALLRNPPRWIPVSERPPEEYQTVLVMTDAGVSAGEIRFPDSECEMDETWWMVFKDMRDRLNSWAGFIPLSVVTHWMPLPEPPEKK